MFCLSLPGRRAHSVHSFFHTQSSTLRWYDKLHSSQNMCIKPSKLFIESREANKHGSTKLGYFLEWMSLIINYNTVKSRRRFRNQKECSLFSEWGAFNKAKTKSILLGQSKRCTHNTIKIYFNLRSQHQKTGDTMWIEITPFIAINQISDLKHNETNRLRRKESRWENWDIEESWVLVKKWLTKRKSKSSHR